MTHTFVGAAVPEMYNRGVKHLHRKNYEKALSFFRKETIPFKELYLNIGSCHSYLGSDMKALDNYLKACDPGIRFANGHTGLYAEALNNVGIIKYSQERDLESLSWYDLALQATPHYHAARWHRSLSYLRRMMSGHDHYPSAFQDYDFRFYVSSNPTAIDNVLPRWDGVSTGASIIVLGEQGIGDTFQWLRYVRCLEPMFDKVWIQLPRSLHEIYAGYNVVEHVHLSDAEVSVPLCSLTRYFPIDSSPPHYLPRPAPHDFNYAGLKIGIVGSGSAMHNNNRRRSCGVYQFLKLVAPGRRLYNLQPGAPEVRGIVNLNPRSWTETGEYISGLDLIISVDTSVVHLAGTLGVPCWVLMPSMDTDWRWGDSTCGTHNVWYPTVTVFRNPNNWDLVFKVVKECLSDFDSKS